MIGINENILFDSFIAQVFKLQAFRLLHSIILFYNNSVLLQLEYCNYSLSYYYILAFYFIILQDCCRGSGSSQVLQLQPFLLSYSAILFYNNSGLLFAQVLQSQPFLLLHSIILFYNNSILLYYISVIPCFRFHYEGSIFLWTLPTNYKFSMVS